MLRGGYLFWTAAALTVSLFALVGRANVRELDKAHRILLERGLQIHALGFHDHRLDVATLKRGNFTGVCWAWKSNPPAMGSPPGIPWNRWATSPDETTLLPEEQPYAPNLVAWQLLDEQEMNNPEVRAAAARWFEITRKRFPNTILYTNQYGGQVTNENMYKYFDECRPDMLSFDTYPILIEADNWRAFYGDAQRYRKLSLGWNIPYAMWIQTFHGENRYRSPTESELWLNYFAAWTFGYKMVTLFTYNSGSSSLFHGRGGDVDPTDAYHWVTEINRQSLNLGPALVRLRSTDLRMLPGQHLNPEGNVADNARPIDIEGWSYNQGDPYIRGFTVENLGTKNNGLKGNVLVGWFKPLHESFDGPDHENEIYFMITNALVEREGSKADYRQRITVNMQFRDSGITSLQRLNRETGKVEVVQLEKVPNTTARYLLRLELDGGEGDLFKFNTGAPFVGAGARAP